MLLGVRLVLIVPLEYKFKPTSPRDADTANTLFLVVYSVPAVCEPFGFVPSDCDIKINTIHEGWCSFLWRRKRDSNPRAFWANGFQDRLVVTASIFLRIYGVVHYTIYTQSYFEVARETRFTNPLRIPHEDASSSLVSSECGYSRPRRDIPLQPFWIVICY